MVSAAFEEDGHLVEAAVSLGECRKMLQGAKPDIIILDRGLPDGDGLQLCLALKKDADFRAIPILMLTGKAEVEDKIFGLRFGADDYLAKPFDVEELRARVHAIVRRVYGEMSPRMTLCGITIDLKARTVTVKCGLIELTNREFSLLSFFMKNPDSVLTREALLEAVWNDVKPGGPKVVDVTVMNLRRKLGGDKSPIRAVRSFGYKFRLFRVCCA
jgi:DNA-binding response OmpR family regulator